MRQEFLLTNPSNMIDVSGWLVKNVASNETLPARTAKLLSFFVNGAEFMKEVFVSHCEAGVMLADRLGMDTGVQNTVRYLWEQWDGKSAAYGLKGDATPQTSRILHFSQVMEVAHRFGGESYATKLASERRGGDFDPDVVDAYLESHKSDDFWAALQMESAKETVLGIRPDSPYDSLIPTEHIDNLCDVVSDFVDIKSPFTWGHSKTVAEVAEGVGSQLGLADQDTTHLRRVALVHDLGKVMVPCSTMEKEAGFTMDEMERIRLHTYYTERILSLVDPLGNLARDASAHHEHYDGSGYHKQLTGEQTTLNQRVLSIADEYATLVQQQGQRPETALRQIKASVGRQFDPDAYEGLVGYVEGRPATAGSKVEPSERPGNLSDREVEVLRQLANGMRNREIATELVISEKTVERHLENIYNKLDVSSRTSAVVFAVQNGLID